MLSKFIKGAADNFFFNILNLEIKECKSNKFHNLLCSKISLYKNDEIYDFLFLFKKESIKEICKLLLFEENPDDDTLIDVLNESANLIVGTAKTMIEEADQNINYTLSTPEYIGLIKDIKTLELDNIMPIKIKNRCAVIAVEEN